MKSLVFIAIASTALLFTGCSMDKFPIDEIDPAKFFQDENELIIYTNSFYRNLPTGEDVFLRDGTLTDIMASANNPDAFITGGYSDNQTELERWWNWDALRNINYFLAHNNNQNIPQQIRDNYNGIARLFRAWFYFDKVKTFGDVPWYDKVLSSSDPDLYKSRDSRVLVMDKILEDIDFACANITTEFNRNGSTITRSVALALKSRICLFEGTFRKYSGDATLAATANKFLTEAANAAEELIGKNNYSIYRTGTTPYRDLFTGDGTVIGSEVILADTYSEGLARYHRANWLFSSSSTGNRPGLTKTFVNSFLNIDGTRFSDNPDYDKTSFVDEVKNRDARLSQMIRTEGYRLLGEFAAPDLGHTKTGYHFIKFTQDDNPNMAMERNTNSIPIIRYAEALLNYAEAKAELGQMSNEIWTITISALRSRARITNTARSTVSDPYLQGLYGSDLSADLLEIRRERTIELVGEGFRFDDLRRWRAGKLLERTWDGIYVENMNEELDLNNDGKKDVSFVTAVPSTPTTGIYYYVSSSNFRVQANSKLMLYSNITKTFDDKMYLYPIPFNARQKNQNLGQNQGW